MNTSTMSNRSNLKLILERIIEDSGISQETWELIKVLKGYSSAYKVFLTIKDTDQFNYFLKPRRFGDLEYSVNYLKEKIRKENKFEYGTQSCGDIILDMLYSISITKHYGAELDLKPEPVPSKNTAIGLLNKLYEISVSKKFPSSTLKKQDETSVITKYESFKHKSTKSQNPKLTYQRTNLSGYQYLLIAIISIFGLISIGAILFLQQAINRTDKILLEDKQRKEYLQQQKQVE